MKSKKNNMGWFFARRKIDKKSKNNWSPNFLLTFKKRAIIKI